jgi:hypothetical protein
VQSLALPTLAPRRAQSGFASSARYGAHASYPHTYAHSYTVHSFTHTLIHSYTTHHAPYTICSGSYVQGCSCRLPLTLELVGMLSAAIGCHRDRYSPSNSSVASVCHLRSLELVECGIGEAH